jgi:hypothetical protein
MDILGQNLGFAIRQLSRKPGFTVTVILTLALSIGANTAIFSIVNALLLKSLPYSHPERIGTIYTRVAGPMASDERHHLNGEQWELLRDNVPALITAVSGIRPSGINLEAGSQVQYVHAGRISEHYLDVLAIHPIIGRNFSEAEDRPHGPKTAILSYSLWHNIFSANPKILGQTVLLKGETYSVLGVLPEGAIIPLSAVCIRRFQPPGRGQEQTLSALQAARRCDLAEGGYRNQSRLVIPHQRYESENNRGASDVLFRSLQRRTATLRPQV